MSAKHITQIIVGAWLIISPWIFGFSSLNLPFWNNVIIGSALILVAVWENASQKNDFV
ncbi:MAG: SPW repeat protein [Candidatus Jorgensenbacteria bacterium]|nr:SPW repeat protein [Candidatus Jorgensenbacteria bacterium]